MKLQGIQLGLASPKMIRLWAERKLVNGKVIGPISNPQTVNYQSFTYLKISYSN